MIIWLTYNVYGFYTAAISWYVPSISSFICSPRVFTNNWSFLHPKCMPPTCDAYGAVGGSRVIIVFHYWRWGEEDSYEEGTDATSIWCALHCIISTDRNVLTIREFPRMMLGHWRWYGIWMSRRRRRNYKNIKYNSFHVYCLCHCVAPFILGRRKGISRVHDSHVIYDHKI